MALATTTNPADFAQRQVVLLEELMLETLLYQLRFEQFADKKTVPAKGTLAVRFFRAAKASRTAQNLAEGVMSAQKTTVGVGSLDCYLNQRGDDFAISDIASAVDKLNTLSIYMKTFGYKAALDYDSIIQASIMGNASTAILAKALGLGAAQTTLYGSNATYGKGCFERFGGVPSTGVSATDFATLAALSAANSKFTRFEGLRAVTQLRNNDIMPPDGKLFPCIAGTASMFDMRQDVDIKSAWTHRDTSQLYKWEEFVLDGAAYLETTNPWTETAYGTYAANGKVFTNLYIGEDAFGTVLISDKKPGGSPAAPKITILDKADKIDIYNQTVVGSYKSYYGSILKITSDPTDVPHVVASRVQSTFA